MTQESYEQIEKFLSGEMTLPEKIAFEQLIRHNAQLAEEVRQHQLLLEGMQLLGRRTQLKKQMDVFHQQMEEEGISRHMQVSRYGLRQMWKKYMPTIAVAASVAIITAISTLSTLTHLRSLDNRQTTYYRELKREFDKFRIQQSRSGTAPNTQPVVKPAQYSATGFMISPNGYVVTNYHVVKEADSVYIESIAYPSQSYKVKVIYRDPSVDLALLKIEDSAFQPLKRLPFALRTEEADLAEPVYTLGYPGDDLVYNDGSISAHTGFDGDTSAYRISIPVNPGNSGGPLLDERGNLLGIISGKNEAAEGAAFAIKSKHLLRMIEQVSPDSLSDPLSLSWKNYVKDMKRPEQIKKLQAFVFNVKVFKSGM